jgi:hypothetical protein
MIPPVPTPAPIANSLLSAPVNALQASTTAKRLGRFTSSDRVSVATFTAQAPLTSPKIESAPAPRRIAQSELPGGSTPPNQAPPAPGSIRDTGKGYPTRIPSNYVGPAVSFSNGSSFGAVSRFAIGERYSVRPSATFGSNGTVLRVPFTYDFAFGEPEPFEANPLANFHAGGGVEFASGGGNVQGDKFSLLGTVGVDLNLFEGVAILADFNTNFGSRSGVTVGVGFEF